MKKLILLLALSSSVLADGSSQRPMLSTPEQDSFFNQVSSLCGSAFSGKVVSTDPADSNFATKELVMHVRKCSEHSIEIPFHVGDDASRTWVLTKTGSGLQLKHDHRHEDGSSDKLTMYGGHTIDAGFAQAQSFPADAPTKSMFSQLGLPQSNGNTWEFYIYPTTFTYRMVRDGREFKVDFDLSKSITPPSAPWGYKD